MEKIKLRGVQRFEEDLRGFAIICHDEKHWGHLATNNLYDPIIFRNREGFLETICWEMEFKRMLESEPKSPLDLSLINQATEVHEGQEVIIPDDVFAPKNAGEEPSEYYKKEDIYIIRGPRPADKAIHLGKGVYVLLAKDKLVGLVVKGAKEKYEKAPALEIS